MIGSSLETASGPDSIALRTTFSILERCRLLQSLQQGTTSERYGIVVPLINVRRWFQRLCRSSNHLGKMCSTVRFLVPSRRPQRKQVDRPNRRFLTSTGFGEVARAFIDNHSKAHPMSTRPSSPP